MKICIVNSYFPPWVGGAETYVVSLSRALLERGHEVTVYCSDRLAQAGESWDNGLTVIRMHTPLTFYGTPMVMFPPSFLLRSFDVLHTNFPSPYLVGISAAVSTMRKIPSVLTWHNDLPDVTSGAGILVKVNKSVSAVYLNSFDRIIATTKAYANSSTILRRYPKKVKVIHNGVDTRRFSPTVDGSFIREKYGLEGKTVALFVGALTRWHEYKGVDVLIRAFDTLSKRLDEVRLLIVGGGNMLRSYEELASSLSISSKIVFAGRQPDEMLPHFYSCCDFVVLPSRNSSEGFGLVLLEAMATGKAVIGSNVGGIREVVSDNDNGLLVTPNDEDNLRLAMEVLFQNPELRTKLAKNGLEFAKAHDWSIVAERVEAIYNEIQ